MLLILFPWTLSGATDTPPVCPKAKTLCLKADQKGEVDLLSGVTTLEGNVSGIHREEDVLFFSERLQIFRDKENQWSRLELESRVRIRQRDTRATANHTIIEPGQILLFGKATVDSPPNRAEGEEILIERERERTTIRGIRDRPILLRLHRDQPPPARDIPEGMTPPATDTLRVVAGQAIVDKKTGTMLLASAVSVVREELDWRLNAQHVRLVFDDQQNLKSFRAEGDVKITQPGRTLQADIAQSRENHRTILLTGNARVAQKGEFELKSNQIEVYADANKGVVQSRKSQEKLTLSFDLVPKNTFVMTRNKISILASRNVPLLTLDKLFPLLDKTYSNRNAFTQAASALLDDEEKSVWLDSIVDQAGSN